VSRIHIKIGEHILLVTCSSEILLKTFDKNFMSLDVSNNIQPNMHIHIQGDFGVPFVNYDMSITEEDNIISYKRADYLIKVDTDYTSASLFVYDELALNHALLNLYSSFIVHHNWGLLIHSSCVRENGKSHIFAGHSGAGKSTAAKLSAPRELLSDEATLLKVTPNEVTVFNSPFRSELDSDGELIVIPLASIQLIHQAIQNKRTELKRSEAFSLLMDKVFFWNRTPEETKKVLHLLVLLVQNVPAYELYFQKNNTFWEMIS
jgi:hypothetical protein